MQSGGTTSTEEPGGTTKARNAQTVVVNMLNHATSALHMAQNVKSVEKLITGHECADQNPNKKHEFDIEEIIEDVRTERAILHDQSIIRESEISQDARCLLHCGT